MPEQALVLLEVEDELRYLFEAPSLPDVQGAAALLETLNRFTLPTLALRRDYQGAGIAWGGSRYLATVPSPEIGRRFLADASRVYRQRTIAAGAGGVCVPVQTEDLVAHFGDVLLGARLRLEDARANTPGTVTAGYGPELRWCDACRVLPASRRSGSDLLCRACITRRGQLADQVARLAVPGYQVSLADASEEDLAARPVWERFAHWARERGLRRGADAAADISVLNASRAEEQPSMADDSGWIAVITMQVNDLERVLSLFDDSQRALRASARVNRLLDDTMFEALASFFWHGPARILQGDVLVAGGDRIVALVPGDRAPALVARCLRGIEGQSAAAIEGRRLSLCAGVGLAPASLPLSVAASAARHALAAARDAYNRASDVTTHGQWRSTVALTGPGVETTPVLNVGELERTLSHARTLARLGLRVDQVQNLMPALRRSADGLLAQATASFTDPQRRAVAAVLRDLGNADAGSVTAGRERLLSAIGSLLPFAAPVPTVRYAEGNGSGTDERPRAVATLRSA